MLRGRGSVARQGKCCVEGKALRGRESVAWKGKRCVAWEMRVQATSCALRRMPPPRQHPCRGPITGGTLSARHGQCFVQACPGPRRTRTRKLRSVIGACCAAGASSPGRACTTCSGARLNTTTKHDRTMRTCYTQLLLVDDHPHRRTLIGRGCYDATSLRSLGLLTA